MTTVKLQFPIQNGETTINELTFRRALLGDMVTANKVAESDNRAFVMLASMCGVPFPVFSKLDIADLTAVMEATTGLLGNETKTGD